VVDQIELPQTYAGSEVFGLVLEVEGNLLVAYGLEKML
jgi:hypothetical protein